MATEKKEGEEKPLILDSPFSTKVRQSGGCHVITVPKKWYDNRPFLRANLEMRTEYKDGKYYLIVEVKE